MVPAVPRSSGGSADASSATAGKLRCSRAHAHPVYWLLQTGSEVTGVLLKAYALLHHIQVGKTLASLAVELRRKSTGQVVATGTHTKYLQVADASLARMRSKL